MVQIIVSSEDSRKRGIYKIDFGERFYIGCANWVLPRMKQHARSINKILSGSPMTPANDYYCHIISHLRKYPEITTGIVCVLEEVPRDGRIFDVEKKWKRFLNGAGMCLNTTESQYWTEDEIKKIKRELDG